MAGLLGEVRVVLNEAQLSKVLRSADGLVMRRMLAEGQTVRLAARRKVGVSKPDPVKGRRNPRRPGTLRDSIVAEAVQSSAGPVVQIGSRLPYARFHHEGTDAHEITPRRGRYLVFWWDRTGRVMFLRRVQHPGTRPNRYLTGPLRDVMARYPR